jgi:hydrogenase/urease accessory protein HupE
VIRIGCIFAALLLAAPAHAHGAMAGGGGFYAGAAHPFVAWEHLSLLLAIGLLLGRRPKRHTGLPLIGLAVALLGGLAAGAAGLGLSVFPGFVLGLGLLSGLLLASALLPPTLAMTILTVSTGIAIGLDTDVPILTASSNIDVYTTYIGVFVAVFLIVLDMMALSLVVKRPPFTIGLRIVGSWIAAVSLMVLALHLRGITGAA